MAARVETDPDKLLELVFAVWAGKKRASVDN
jgi:hypothetical protein